MKLVLLIGILATVVALATFLVIALYLHKKAGVGEIKLIGQIGAVQTKLDPEGAVIVAGELWRAQSQNGEDISAPARVRVVGFEGHLAVVEPCD